MFVSVKGKGKSLRVLFKTQNVGSFTKFRYIFLLKYSITEKFPKLTFLKFFYKFRIIHDIVMKFQLNKKRYVQIDLGNVKSLANFSSSWWRSKFAQLRYIDYWKNCRTYFY